MYMIGSTLNDMPTVIEVPLLHFDYDKYSSYIQGMINFNRFKQDLISRELGSKLKEVDAEVAIGLTGSDARLENSVFSTAEFVLYHYEANLSNLKAILNGYLSNLEDGSIKILDPEGNVLYEDNEKAENPFDPDLESKVVTQPGIYTTTFMAGFTTKTIISPNRVLDFRMLIGDESLVVDAKKRLIEDIKGSKKTIKTHLKQHFNNYYDCTFCGEQEYYGKFIRHFDIEGGVAYCNPAKSQTSFKYGPLRLVQFSLVRRIVREIKANKLVLEQLSKMPCNTAERISWLEEQGFIGNSELSDHYNFFLAQYHKAQHAAYMGEFVVAFDASDVKQRLDYVAKTCRTIVEN